MSEETATPETDAATPAKAPRKTAASKTSTPEPDKEPTESRVDSLRAKPAVVPATPNSAVSSSGVDTIYYSKAIPAGKNGPRNSLTVQHIQRRLAEHGYTEAWSETRYGALTESSVHLFQNSRNEDETGVLTRAQFQALFSGDQNVSLVMDTIGDHPVSVS